VAGVILIMWNAGREKIYVINNLDEGSVKYSSSDNIVNDLMLSANDLNIYGKSSLIGYKNNTEPTATDLLLQQVKNNPENAYQAILKNKIEKLNHKAPSSNDFYIKPTPK
jgi:hypothetical protein